MLPIMAEGSQSFALLRDIKEVISKTKEFRNMLTSSVVSITIFI